MPLSKGKSKSVISRNISEFHGGKTYARTARKFGKSRANDQAVAVAMSQAGKTRKRSRYPMPKKNAMGYY